MILRSWVLFAVVALGDGGGTSYRYDDGSIEGVWGNTSGSDADYCWFHRFDAVEGGDLITHVDVVFGWELGGCSVLDGTPLNVCVWNDPNDDGDPADAVLLTNVSRVVRGSGTNEFTEYAIPPTAVTGVFFVGCYLTVPPQTCVSPDDLSSGAPGLSWIACNSTPGAFDPTCLPCNGCGPFDMYGDFGASLVWLLRARGEALPFTYCTAKTNSCGTLPSIIASGVPRAGATGGFVVSAVNAKATKSAMLLYTNAGAASIPFDGGLLCVGSPIRRALLVPDSSGTPGSCDGMVEIDLNCFASGQCGGDPAGFLSMPGAQVNCQWWGRDTATTGSLLTDALQYFVFP